MGKNALAGFVFLLLAYSGAAQCISGDCVNGNGVMIYTSGARYAGDFRNGIRQGWGICYYSDGTRYFGNWSGDRFEGKGVRTTADGTLEKGYWKKGNLIQRDPSLVLEFDGQEGRIGSGCISGNCLNGQGVFLYADGGIYSGDFVNGRRNGIGVCYYANRSEYKGSWINDQPDGRGTMVYADGRQRTGIWRQGQPVEVNEPEWPSDPATKPAVIEKCLSGNCQDGSGTFLFADGSRYSGTFKDGVPHGQGVVFYPNGERYEGMMMEGRLHGRGTIYYPNGRKISGFWDKGIYAQSLDSESAQPQSRPEVAPKPTVKVWAVIVGIASYSHLQALRYTDDDAYRIYAFLKGPEGGAVADEQMRLLIDEAATRNNILQAMREIFFKAGPNDLVILYFSGHGLPGCFLPIDFDGLNNKIQHEEINNILRQSPAKFKLCIADACHSGGMLAAREAQPQTVLMNYYNSLAQAQPGTALIMSSKSEETSLEAAGLRQGVFSHYLIKALKGEADVNNDKIVTIQELFDFVYFGVRQYTGNQQSPVIRGDYDRKMTVSVRY